MHSVITSLLAAAIAAGGFAATAQEASPAVLSGMQKEETLISVDMTNEEAAPVVIASAPQEEEEEEEEILLVLPEEEEEWILAEEVQEDVAVRILTPSDDELTGTVAPCQKGDQNDNVYVLQERLRTLGFMMEEADGIFGGRTETHVKEVQNYLFGKTGGVA